MMLPDTEEIYADLVGENPLLDDVPDALRWRNQPAVSAPGYISERVQP
jgi:hypothetical protein